MDKHAFLIMAHNQFPLLGELIGMLDHERSDIFLHIDKKVSKEQMETLCGIIEKRKAEGLKASVYFTDRVDVHWGGYSQIRCEMTLLKAASEKGSYAYYHLLSGTDLPLKSMDAFYAFFDELSGKCEALPEFLAFDEKEVPTYVRERISLYHPFREKSGVFWEIADAMLAKVQRICRVDRIKKKDPKMIVQKGANWFSITDDLVRYTVGKEKEIEEMFSSSVCADEVFLQTLAANSEFADRIYAPYETGADTMAILRYIDWERGSNNSPYIFQREDKEMLLEKPHLFARKFAENIFS